MLAERRDGIAVRSFHRITANVFESMRPFAKASAHERAAAARHTNAIGIQRPMFGIVLAAALEHELEHMTHIGTRQLRLEQL